LHTTEWRLGAAAGFTHYLSNLHFPPPLRQTARCTPASTHYHIIVVVFSYKFGRQFCLILNFVP
jgi:hypothetical protein